MSERVSEGHLWTCSWFLAYASSTDHVMIAYAMLLFFGWLQTKTGILEQEKEVIRAKVSCPLSNSVVYYMVLSDEGLNLCCSFFQIVEVMGCPEKLEAFNCRVLMALKALDDVGRCHDYRTSSCGDSFTLLAHPQARLILSIVLMQRRAVEALLKLAGQDGMSASFWGAVEGFTSLRTVNCSIALKLPIFVACATQWITEDGEGRVVNRRVPCVVIDHTNNPGVESSFKKFDPNSQRIAFFPHKKMFSEPNYEVIPRDSIELLRATHMPKK